MLYYDYIWDLSPFGIILDDELNTESEYLMWHEGDYFKLVIKDGRRVLKRIEQPEKFLLDGTLKDNQQE
jgi:hypothetical protein